MEKCIVISAERYTDTHPQSWSSAIVSGAIRNLRTFFTLTMDRCAPMVVLFYSNHDHDPISSGAKLCFSLTYPILFRSVLYFLLICFSEVLCHTIPEGCIMTYSLP